MIGIDRVELSLSKLVAELDVQGEEILKNQNETLGERKKLAEQTKGNLSTASI